MFVGSNFVGKGLGLRFAADADDVLAAVMTFDERQMGPPQIVHGGALAAVIDEAMTATIFHHREPAFTAQLNISYRQPVRVGQPVTVRAWMKQREGRKRWLYADIRDEAGTLCAEAEGLFILMDPTLAQATVKQAREAEEQEK